MESKIVVPEIGESIVDATLSHWLKKPGDRVAAGEAVAELETDKVNLEVPAETSGVLTRVERQEGDDVHVGDVLGVITESALQPEPAQMQSEPARTKTEPEAVPIKRTGSPAPIPIPGLITQAAAEEKVTPLARRIAEGQGIDLTRVQGSGPGGRVFKEDVEKFFNESTVQPGAVKPVNLPGLQPRPGTVPAGSGEERLRMSRRRRTIAQRLVEAQHSAAMLTTFNDVDMTAVMDIRQQHKQVFKDKFGVSLGIVSFFVKASIPALKDFPRVNAEIQGDEIVLKHYYDIGIAIGAEEGLVVPVLRNADRMSFSEIEMGIQSFVQKSQAGTLSLEDLRGGTFTITNGGIFGSMLSTPILNSPQVAILGLHRIEERPVAVNHQVVLRQMMYLAVSYDHRIVDGREAVQFLVRIKEAIEHPEVLLLEL
jgi:2-oxoglutarate dehydrogenase E2 component (dihydrolipoamide succinyltransferase)